MGLHALLLCFYSTLCISLLKHLLRYTLIMYLFVYFFILARLLSGNRWHTPKGFTEETNKGTICYNTCRVKGTEAPWGCRQQQLVNTAPNPKGQGAGMVLGEHDQKRSCDRGCLTGAVVIGRRMKPPPKHSLDGRKPGE